MLWPLALLTLTGFAADLEISAERGPAILREQGCVNCHAIGSGGGATPSAAALSRTLNREYTPAGLTATLWNHAPQMWSEIRAKGVRMPQLSERDAADVFGYFAALRYFEPMGEAYRGARLFATKRCETCHAVSEGGSGVARPVGQWNSMSDPVALIGMMWNHVPQMRTEMTNRGIRWPALTAQELSDILVYVRGLRDTRRTGAVHFELPPLEGAHTLVDAYGCNTCHKGELSFDKRTTERTLTEVAAAMWNHGPNMVQNPATIPAEEMRKIVSWVWGRQFFRPTGSAAKGRSVAESKKCVTCHESGGSAPAFSSLQGPYSVIRLTSALWKHGPNMLGQMNAKGIRWPRLKPADVQNLIAYIDSKGPARTAAVRRMQ
jgi:mono/diheme cytochrome c family protein